MDEKWGFGNGDKKAWAKVKLGQGKHAKEVGLVHGEHPHSRQDNTTYAIEKDGTIHDFDGHRLCCKIEIEEYNYLKESHISGDEIRKGCSVKLYVNGIQILDEFSRTHEWGYKKVVDHINKLEQHWDWFPSKTDKYIGKVVSYNETLCKITSIITHQSCVILETIDGKPFPNYRWNDEDEDEKENSIKVNITSDNIYWYPKWREGDELLGLINEHGVVKLKKEYE